MKKYIFLIQYPLNHHSSKNIRERSHCSIETQAHVAIVCTWPLIWIHSEMQLHMRNCNRWKRVISTTDSEWNRTLLTECENENIFFFVKFDIEFCLKKCIYTVNWSKQVQLIFTIAPFKQLITCCFIFQSVHSFPRQYPTKRKCQIGFTIR